MSEGMIESPDEDACALVGQDDEGRWIVRDLAGQYGGIFVSRKDALKYASVEGAAHQPHRDRVILVDRLSFVPTAGGL